MPRNSGELDRVHRPGAARQADEGARAPASLQRHRDHRPHRHRPRLRGGARRVGRARRRQRRAVAERPLPEPGPAAARPRRRQADRRRRRRALRAGLGRRAAHRARRQPLPQRHVPRVGPRARGARARRVRSSRSRAASPRRSQDFADNTMRYLREEGRLLAEGIDFPPLTTRLPRPARARRRARARATSATCGWFARTCATSSPCCVAVDGGAEALIEEGWKPDVIVGDMDSVSDATLRCGAEILVHAYREGDAPGEERLRTPRRSVPASPRPGSARTSRCCSPTRRAPS